MSKGDSDSNLKKHNVQLHHAQLGHVGEGKLHFGGNLWAQVSLSLPAPAALADGTQFDMVRAVTEDGTSFSLCVCKVHGHALHAEYVIEADLTATEIDSIRVQYSDVSEWFLHWQNVKGDVGETLTWTQVPQAIEVTVKTQDEHFELRSEYMASRQRQGEDLVLHEHVEFVFTAKARRFGLADIKAKTHELSCLLSILLAYPATIARVMVSQDAARHFCLVHFPTFERPDRDMDDSGFWLRCFIQQPALESRWQSTLDHYYRSKYRRVCWVRLAGMQRYEGFWEYKALGYVSVLDRYLSIRFKGKKRSAPEPPSKERLEKFRRHLAKDLPKLTPARRTQIVKVASRSFASDDATFGDRYRLAMTATDADVAKIVGLSDEEFRLIKRVRDKIAHGDDHGLKDDEFTNVIRTEGKIALLLTYWAFLDFGLTTRDFIKCLKTTHSKLRFSALLNELHLSRVTGSAQFFPVTMEKLQFLRGIKALKLFGCCIEDESGEMNYSEEFTKIYEDWRKDPSKSSGVQNSESIFGVDKARARIVGQGYFECGDERLGVHHMWVIKRSEL
jgi:hypothetical protein